MIVGLSFIIVMMFLHGNIGDCGFPKTFIKLQNFVKMDLYWLLGK